MPDNLYKLAQKHLGIDDVQAIQLVLTAAVSVYDDLDPLWIMPVGPPSAGKSTLLRLTGALSHEVMDDPTLAGLLSRDASGVETGVLPRIGKRGLIVIPDFSTVLAGSNKGARDSLFAHLRRVHDGSTSRDTHGGRMQWEGRVVIIAAVTSAIDNYTAYQAELGPRFVYLRSPDHDVETKIARLRDSRSQIRELAEIQQSTRRLVDRASLAISGVTVNDKLLGIADMAALICAYGRTSVPRDGYRRDVVGVAETEEPFRLRNQMMAIVRGGLALGLDDDAISALVCRVARDSIPQGRRRVLEALARFNGDEPTTAQIARAEAMDWNVANRALEDLQLSHMVALVPSLMEDEAKHKKWVISDTFKSLFPFVFNVFYRPRK
jgi:hypothetical protein